MKAVHLFSLFLFALSLSTAQARGIDIDVEKTYSKSYNLNSNDLVRIENKFGSIDFKIWDKSEVKVDATITASARKERKAQEILDALEIRDRKSNDEISFVTKIGKGKNIQTNGKSGGIGFKVTMNVFIPKRQALELLMEFGEVELPDYEGELEIVCKFSQLRAGKLDNLKSLELEFGGGEIESIHDADVVSKFSSLEIDDASGNIDLRLEFSNDCEINISSSITELDLVAKNSGVTLELPQNLSAHYDIETSFGELKNRTDFDIKAEKRSGFDVGLDKEYRGTIGSGKANIEIDADFSEIRLEH